MCIKKFTVLASTLILMLAACSQYSNNDNTKPQAEVSSITSAASADNSQNSLDWPGTYTGILPCADCEGIAIRISLDSALHYTLSETYLGKSNKPILAEGMFVWSSDGGRITLQGIEAGARSTQFQVGENQLIQLDLQGAKIEGALAEKYILSKTADNIAGTL
jgi:copper homeostasis protein (lipoprotein)